MKEKILLDIRLAGMENDFQKCPVWMAAFEYYWAQTGDTNLKPGCGSCYKMLLDWLKK